MTTPTRRIRNARLRYARSHAAARACILTARMRSKDIALRAVARAGDDAMLAADALRMERDAAHEECARLAEIVESKHWAAYEIARGLTLGDPTLTKHADGSVSIRWGSDREDAAIVTREALQSIVDDHTTLTAERDHARAIAVALEQEAAVRYSGNRVPMDSDRTPEVEG